MATPHTNTQSLHPMHNSLLHPTDWIDFGRKGAASPGASTVHDYNELTRLKVIVSRIENAIEALDNQLLQETTNGHLHAQVQERETLSRNLDALTNKKFALEWKELSRSRSFGFAPGSTASILRICKDVGNASAVISALSASIAITILFSAVRGNLFYFFAAWWCSIISLTSSLGISVLSTRDAINATRSPRPFDWWKLHLSGLITAICLGGAVSAIISMCYGVMFFDVSAELSSNAEPHIVDGPSIPGGLPKASLIIASILVFIFCGGAFTALFVGPFRFARRTHWVAKDAALGEREMTNVPVTV